MPPDEAEDLTLKLEHLEEKVQELENKILFVEGFLALIILMVLAKPFMNLVHNFFSR